MGQGDKFLLSQTRDSKDKKRPWRLVAKVKQRCSSVGEAAGEQNRQNIQKEHGPSTEAGLMLFGSLQKSSSNLLLEVLVTSQTK